MSKMQASNSLSAVREALAHCVKFISHHCSFSQPNMESGEEPSDEFTYQAGPLLVAAHQALAQPALLVTDEMAQAAFDALAPVLAEGGEPNIEDWKRALISALSIYAVQPDPQDADLPTAEDVRGILGPAPESQPDPLTDIVDEALGVMQKGAPNVRPYAEFREEIAAKAAQETNADPLAEEMAKALSGAIDALENARPIIKDHKEDYEAAHLDAIDAGYAALLAYRENRK